jgi:hypothetical protein
MQHVAQIEFTEWAPDVTEPFRELRRQFDITINGIPNVSFNCSWFCGQSPLPQYQEVVHTADRKHPDDQCSL